MQKKKYEVVICSGTLCHVLGGSELPALGNYLPEEWKDMVEIKGSPCINHCKDKSMKPPFVEINGCLIQEASITKLINHLKTCIENDSKQE